jgi:hypothetical protein
MAVDTRNVHIKQGAKELVIGTSSKITLLTNTAPATPEAGSVVIWFDGTDMMAKNSAGKTSVLTGAQAGSWSA